MSSGVTSLQVVIQHRVGSFLPTRLLWKQNARCVFDFTKLPADDGSQQSRRILGERNRKENIMWVKRFWRRWWCWFLSLILTQSNIFYTIWYGNIRTLNREHELLGHNNYCNTRREEVIHKLFSSFFGEFSPKHHISSSFSSKIKPQKWHTLMNT